MVGTAGPLEPGATEAAPHAMGQVAHLKRNYTLLGGLLAGLATGAGLLWAELSSSMPGVLLVGGLVAAMMSGVGFFYVLRTNALRRARWGELVVDRDVLTVGGELVAKKRELVRGFVLRASPSLPPPARAEVRLERHWPRAPIELAVADEHAGRALLRRLGLDVSQTAASFVLASILRAQPWSGFVSWTLVGASLFIAPMFVATPFFEARLLGMATWCALVLWIVASVVPSRIVVGTDGLLVSWLFARRFVPHEHVRAVRPLYGRARGVYVVTEDGALRLSVRRALTSELEERAAEVVRERLVQALEEHRAGMIGSVHGGALHARADDVHQWVRALRSAGTGASADHRTAAVRTDVLWRVVEDPAAPGAQRAAAAVALSATVDESSRARIRVAAEATAAPEVRAVLEAVAEGADEPALARALARLDRA